MESPNMEGDRETKFMRQYIDKARITPGETTQGQIELPWNFPPWVQPQLLKEGQAFVRRHFFVVIVTHMISLVILLSYGPVRDLLLRTQKSDTPNRALRRYVSTLLHLKVWYEGSLSDPGQDTVQDIASIRRIHARVSTLKCRKDPQERAPVRSLTGPQDLDSSIDHPHTTIQDLSSTPIPIISQLDMVVTQFCFMGFLALSPGALGIPDNKRERRGLKGFVHLWALFGHLLGIQDEFNLALPQNTYALPFILRHVLFRPESRGFDAGSKGTALLQESLTSGISGVIPMISLPAILHFVNRRLVGGLSGSSSLIPHLAIRDKLCYKLMIFLNSWVKFGVVRVIFNLILRAVLLYWTIQIFGWRKRVKKVTESRISRV